MKLKFLHVIHWMDLHWDQGIACLVTSPLPSLSYKYLDLHYRLSRKFYHPPLYQGQGSRASIDSGWMPENNSKPNPESKFFTRVCISMLLHKGELLLVQLLKI